MARLDTSADEEYIEKHNVHLMFHGMVETLTENRDTPTFDALCAYLNSNLLIRKNYKLTNGEKQSVASQFAKKESARVLQEMLNTTMDSSPRTLTPNTQPNLRTPSSTATASGGLRWHKPLSEEYEGEGPPARAGHSSAVLGDYLWTFGGNHAGNFQQDFWRLSLRTCTWERIETENPPPNRAGHTLLVSGKNLVVFGGAGGGDLFFNDLWAFDTTQKLSDKENPPEWAIMTVGGAPPSPRAGHSACIQEGKMHIIGGEDGKQLCGDHFAIGLEDREPAWESLGAGFPARNSHACAVFRNEIWVFGGDVGGGESTNSFTNDLWVYAPERAQGWLEVKPDGAQPGARAAHSMVSFGPKLVVFGGTRQGEFISDVLVLDLSTSRTSPKWTSPPVSGVVTPAARAGVTMNVLTAPPPDCTSEALARVRWPAAVVFGGYDSHFFRHAIYILELKA